MKKDALHTSISTMMEINLAALKKAINRNDDDVGDAIGSLIELSAAYARVLQWADIPRVHRSTVVSNIDKTIVELHALNNAHNLKDIWDVIDNLSEIRDEVAKNDRNKEDIEP